MKTNHRILSVLMIFALVASLTAVMVAPAAAATPVLTLHPTSGPAGAEVRVLGHDFPGNVVAELTASPAGVIGREVLMITAAGTIDLTVTIRSGAPVGAAEFRIHIGGVLQETAPFTVTVLPARITLSPRSGLPGTGVTVTGVRFPANAPGLIEAPGVITPVTFMTTAAGAIPATAVSILPGAPVGAQTITAKVGDVDDTATFTVIEVPVPTIELEPTAARRGDTVTVRGQNFPAGAPGIITAPGVIAPITFATTAEGEIPVGITVRILWGAPFGLTTITARVGVVSDDAFFTVLPPLAAAVSLSPPSGARGTEVTVTGANFPAGTAGVIMAPGVIAPVGFTTDGLGRIPAFEVRILGGAPFGAATFTATVGVVSDTAAFTVHSPFARVRPVGGVLGAEVTVDGRGFPPGRDGTITAPGVISPTGFRTTAAGGVPVTTVNILPVAPLGAATFTITVDPPGPPAAVTATATYTVGITPSITLSPTIGFEGTSVTVTGFGFPTGAPGAITAPGVIGRVGLATDAAGKIPATTVTIRTGAPVGAATITVTIAGVTATAVFTVAGPGVPVIVPQPVVPILEGLEPIKEQLGEAVWHFKDGNWFRFHTDPAIQALIPAGERLTELVSGDAYWIYLTEDVTDVLIGGVVRTLRVGWHNIGWVL